MKAFAQRKFCLTWRSFSDRTEKCKSNEIKQLSQAYYDVMCIDVEKFKYDFWINAKLKYLLDKKKLLFSVIALVFQKKSKLQKIAYFV